MENEEKKENLDSQNETEGTEKTNEEEVADTESEETEGESKPKYTDNEKKLYARMKTAEADAKLAKDQLAKSKTSEKPAPVGDIDKLLDAKLEKRELESLDLSDELKKEIQAYAKVQGVSIRKALTSEYVTFLKEKEEKKQRAEDASLGSNRKGTTKKDYSEMKVTDFDMTTPEGRKEFDAYRADMRKKLG